MGWLKLSAEQNNPKALSNLALLHANGLGTQKNLEVAAKLMEKSAEMGNIYAQYNAGIFYRDGDGVAIDLMKSNYWFQLAADQNFPEAQVDLAISYAKGLGVEVNMVASLRLNYLAEKAGSTRAVQLKDLLEKQASPEEIKKAKLLAES